jgi:small subunit ribosomal protein S14
MRYIVAKDKRRRDRFSRFEKRRLIFKVLQDSKSFLKPTTNKAVKVYFETRNKDNFATRIVNRCAVTGKSGGVFRFFRMSRMEIKSFFGLGKLYGFKRSSW